MRRIILTIGILCLTGLGLAENGQRSFNVTPGQKVTFKLDTGGSIEVTGWDQAVLSVEYNVTGRDAADCRVEFRQTSTGVEIASHFVGSSHNRSTDLELKLKLPHRFDIDVNTLGGSVAVKDLEGRIEGKTMGGELDLRNLKGELSLTTMGGDITLADSQVDGKVETMGGKVLVQNVTGDIKGSSMGGDVVYQNVQVMEKSVSGRVLNKFQSVGDEVNITTMGGDIRVVDAPVGANVSTMGGDIEIQNAKQYVKAKTMGGDIVIHAVDGTVNAVTMGGDVEIHVTGTGDDARRDIDIQSMSGEVTLYVPENLSMAFDITLAYTKNSKQNYQIKSDFGVQVRSTDQWDYAKGSPRKYFYGSGSHLGGKNVVKIRTINGNVNILRARHA